MPNKLKNNKLLTVQGLGSLFEKEEKKGFIFNKF
jgi:hypothetical protein